MRTAAWDTAPQRALRDCSREVAGKGRIYVILVKGNSCNEAHLFVRKFQLVL